MSSVGFIGLGNMGLPMSINLATANDSKMDVIAFDANPTALNLAKEAGMRTASSVEEIGASNCSVIITMLPGCQAVDAVTPMLLESCDPNASTLFVDCSTVHPSTSRRWNEELKEKGHTRMDAPVSGGVKGATDGTLTFMVGCDDPATLQHAQPLLDIMGQRSIHCGTAGAGSATKLCNNLALAAQMLGICEAMNLGESLGVDPIVLAQVMNTSTAKSWSCEVNNPHPVVATDRGTGAAANRYEGGFGSKLMQKDLSLAVSAGADAGVALPVGVLSKELYHMATLHGLGDKDFGVMLQFLRGQKP
ncbi:hydroxyisobutyrate dehydrogenase, mitochondrial [Seminavis robusta]|uniref:3-hydroxyisobutyrate dehydrogenase n=1 Tax=Seminavis robusta TaxID=568900 RepID=A0A9N8HUH4_9STRA|nr:hydroxyisobutyrate dehydrogenase, mitochondrial [Seminavis robusta]|eukprot:Sro1752_g295370.1 hydroxyisobutyrate dehydrogenase, mitochondrial (305) ;mRNA; r:20158-21297